MILITLILGVSSLSIFLHCITIHRLKVYSAKWTKESKTFPRHWLLPQLSQAILGALRTRNLITLRIRFHESIINIDVWKSVNVYKRVMIRCTLSILNVHLYFLLSTTFNTLFYISISLHIISTTYHIYHIIFFLFYFSTIYFILFIKLFFLQ